MINPTSYDRYSGPLASAGQQVTLGIGAALKKYWRQLISQPLNNGNMAFRAAVAYQATKWTNEWKQWTDEELALSYLDGISHTDKELAAMGIVRQPSRPISHNSPLLPRVLSSSFEVATTSDRFSGYANHTGFYGLFRQAAHQHLEGTDVRIMRSALDLARDAAVKAGEQVFRESDIFTRQKFAQEMLRDFADKGIRALQYYDGRWVSLESYSEMVGRSLSGRCAVQASLNRYQEYGYDLVRITAHFRACPLCTPWEGRVLSHSGESAEYPSLGEAVEAGLFHSNCAHNLNPYFPGISEELPVFMDPAEQTLVDRYGYHRAQEISYIAQQRQREIERHIRAWKRRETVALTSEESTKARAKVREWQAAQREHVSQHPYLPRLYAREQIR